MTTLPYDGADTDFADVPGADPGAEIDPHWLRLRGESTLPSVYMPPAMPGSHPGWMRAMATFLVAIFLLATGLGICLTYGSPIGMF
jgi:hypothetical protein